MFLPPFGSERGIATGRCSPAFPNGYLPAKTAMLSSRASTVLNEGSLAWTGPNSSVTPRRSIHLIRNPHRIPQTAGPSPKVQLIQSRRRKALSADLMRQRKPRHLKTLPLRLNLKRNSRTRFFLHHSKCRKDFPRQWTMLRWRWAGSVNVQPHFASHLVRRSRKGRRHRDRIVHRRKNSPPRTPVGRRNQFVAAPPKGQCDPVPMKEHTPMPHPVPGGVDSRKKHDIQNRQQQRRQKRTYRQPRA